MSVARRALSVGAAVVAASLTGSDQAFAHGLSSRSDVPIPVWLYGWGAALVLAISFFAFAALWKEPRLENAPERRIAKIPLAVDVLCGVLGVQLFAILVYAGFAGSQIASENIIVTFVYVLFWAALPFICALFGDVFRPFNPWRAVGRFVGWAARGISGRELPPTFAYPERLGRWPALIGLLAFGWLELVSTNGTDPSYVALAATCYALLQLIGMSLFGVDRWLERGDAFAVYFEFFGRMAVLGARDGYLVKRRFLAGLTELQWMPVTVTFICATIGITAFDGFAEGEIWTSVGGELADFFASVGFSTVTALQIAYTIGLVAMVGVVTLIYRLGIWGMSGSAIDHTPAELSRMFASSLIPIALAYVVAHYFSYVVFQSQGMIALVSDPLGDGANYLGTATHAIDYTVLGSNTIWFVQVAALVAGHALGLAVAHDKALAVFGHAKAAVRSQYWMLVVMVGFTNLGLWLLSVANQ